MAQVTKEICVIDNNHQNNEKEQPDQNFGEEISTFNLLEENLFNFKYIKTVYKYYKTKTTVYNDFLFQIKENFGERYRDSSKDSVQQYLDLRFKLLMPTYKFYGIEFSSTSVTRLLPFEEQYMDFVSQGILDLFCTNSITNKLFRTLGQDLTRDSSIILTSTSMMMCHRNLCWVNFLFPLKGFITSLIIRINMGVINRQFDYITSINIVFFKALGLPYTRSKNAFLKQLYEYTFIDYNDQMGGTTPLDYCLFLIANGYQFDMIVRLLPHVIEDMETCCNKIIVRDNNELNDFMYEIMYWVHDFITGRIKFIQSGGESNPGPGLDFIKEWILNYMRRTFGPAFDAIQEAGELAKLSAHLMRLFTSISDALASFMTGRALAPIDFTCRISSLILSAYESHKYFGEKMNFRLKPNVRGQAGPFENILISSVLAYGAPQFIKDLMRDVPKFTTTKILDDSTWFYDLFSFIISIPRRVLSLFEDVNKTGVISILAGMLLSIEDLFPFSSLCRIKTEMEKYLKIVNDDPIYAINEANQNIILELDTRRKKVEETYKSHKKNYPTYYEDTSKRFDRLYIKILKYRSDVRVEPVCIVIKGPKGTGKTVLMNKLVQMYKNSGSRVFTDNIPASLDTSKFYDTYEDEEVYVVDDLGAKAKAQWSEIVNQVSSAKYPLNAAALATKNTKFFNSQLMFISCNDLPEAFGPNDGVADVEAFNRRLILFDFENVKFDGRYTGRIEVKRFNDIMGVKSFTTRRTFDVDEETGQFILPDIEEFLFSEMDKKVKIYEENKAMNLQYAARPIPKAQALGQDLYRSFTDMVSQLPGIDWIVGQMFEIMGQAMDELNKLNIGSFWNTVSNYRYYVMFITFATAASGLAIYYKMKENSEHQQVLEQVHLEYKPTIQKKRSFEKMVAQGVTTLDGQIEPAVPQLLPYQENVCVTTYYFQDLEGKSKTAKCRSLFSVDKILTTWHMFDEADKTKPIYVTAQSGKNIIYDYMEVSLVVARSLEDWCIFRLPETSPKLMKKIKMATTNTSFKLYMAMGENKICNLGTSITQYDFGVDYKYGNYSGKLSSKDLMYDLEEDGLCGSLLLTKDGRILGMHVAGVEYYDENDKMQTRGIAKLFTNESYNFIMGFLSISVNDKTNLECELKDRCISGVYLNTNDKCYGVEGTRYVKSPISGVFPYWRKPALEIPKEKQDYKILSEGMLNPAPTANLEALEFAAKVLDEITTDKFDNLTEHEIVGGNGVLKPINPQTSTGYSLKLPDKKQYLNYEDKTIKPEFKQELREFTDKIVNDEYKFEDAATLVSKDELKDVMDPTDPDSQPKKIRIFTNYHLISTVLFRFFFGNLLTFVMEHRDENGIMIGINPLSDQWDKLARKLNSINGKVFDGDYGFFDKNMHPVFQRKLNHWLKGRVRIKSGKFNEIFGTNYNDTDVEKILDQILECIISTAIISKNKKLLTTHGLPSGIFLTAFYNSCINKMYTAYVYRMVCPPAYASIHSYVTNALLCFYGDDIIGAISERIRSFFNPVAFSKIMKSLGLDFTPANKEQEWTETNQFKRLEDSSFLKRSFYRHPKLNQIVAPLSIKSIEGTMNYVTDGAKSTELIMDKCYNFQREMFLHPGDLYHSNMNKLKKACQEKNLHFAPLSEQYLQECYTAQTYSELLEQY